MSTIPAMLSGALFGINMKHTWMWLQRHIMRTCLRAPALDTQTCR